MTKDSAPNDCLQSKHPTCECFLTKFFYREGFLAPRPTAKQENHPSSAVRDCLFNLLAATLLIGGRSSIRNLRTRQAVVIGTISVVVIYCGSTSSKFCHPIKLHLIHPTGPVSTGDDLCHFRWPYQSNITLAFIRARWINLHSPSTCTSSCSINPSLKRLQKFSLRFSFKNLVLIGDEELAPVQLMHGASCEGGPATVGLLIDGSSRTLRKACESL